MTPLPAGPLRLWVDDLRAAPSRFNVWAKTVAEADEALSTCRVIEISLDHDLGTQASGYDVACRIERGAYFGTLPRLTWNVHSANAPGRASIEAALQRADSFWQTAEAKELRQ